MATTMIAAPLTAYADTADEAALKTIVESVGNLADRGNFDTLATLFDDEVMVDYSSLSGENASVKSPKALMTEWSASLPGFDRTRHEIGDVRVSVDGDTATAKADVVASHWVGDAMWQVDGSYDYAFARDGEDWKITSMTFNLENETGSRDVFGPAMQNAEANPSDFMLRQTAQQLVLDFLTGLEDKDMDRVNGVWADDAVQEMPYTRQGVGFPDRVVGKPALIKQYAGWPENAGNANFTDEMRFYPSPDPRTVIVEYRGVSEIVTTGRTYDQKYIGVFHTDNGKITLFREYFDPNVFANAFKLKPDGGTFYSDE